MKIRFLLYLFLLISGDVYGQTHKPLAVLLQQMCDEDQTARHMLDGHITKDAATKQKRDSIYKIIARIDSLNNPKLKQILKAAKRFPNYDMVGEKGSNNFWLLVQHQDNDTAFQKEVLNMMTTEVQIGKASVKNYVYLLDRVMLNTSGKQIYGTQLWLLDTLRGFEPRPILIMPDKVDERRKEVGLDPIDVYIKYLNDNHGIKTQQNATK